MSAMIKGRSVLDGVAAETWKHNAQIVVTNSLHSTGTRPESGHGDSSRSPDVSTKLDTSKNISKAIADDRIFFLPGTFVASPFVLPVFVLAPHRHRLRCAGAF